MLRKCFNAPDDIKMLLATEQLMRVNAPILREYARNILIQRDLPLSVIAYDYFIQVNDGKFRKDGITPAEQHEQLHILMLDALLKSDGNKLGYDPKKYGSQDALFAAVIFHDVIEDHKHEDLQLYQILSKGIRQTPRYQSMSTDEKKELLFDARQAVDMVRIMSRNWPIDHPPSRSEYNNRWIGHPGSALIKSIDWCNKLGTMVGVAPFEQGNQWRMKRNLEETSHLFVDERQGITRHAANMHPGIAKKLDSMDAFMAVLFYMLKDYTLYSGIEYKGDPKIEYPSGYGKHLPRVMPIVRNLPDGANLILAAAARIREQAIEPNNRLQDFCDYNMKVALAPMFSPVPTWSIMKPFQRAASCVSRNIVSPWKGLQRD